MKIIFKLTIRIVFVLVIFALVSVDASPADGLKIKANYGEDVTLNFTMDKVEEANLLKITFTSETTNETRVIAQNCTASESCDVVETPGVKLRVEQGRVSVIIQKVNSSRSGLYKVEAIIGNDVSEADATLVVKEAPLPSSAAPTDTSTSDLHWLCALIPLLILGGGFTSGITGGHHVSQELMLKTTETSEVSRSSVSQKLWKSSFHDCGAVMNGWSKS